MFESKLHKDFRGIWLPKEILFNQELSLIEKTFLSVIISLCNNDSKECTAANTYFMVLFGLKKVRVSNIINKLKRKGFIEIAIKYKDDTKEVSGRSIYLLQFSVIGIVERDNRVLQQTVLPYYPKVCNIIDTIKEFNIREEGTSSSKELKTKKGLKEKFPLVPTTLPLTLPFESERFKILWDELVASKKWKSKSLNALSISLKKLAKYEEDFACNLVSEAIEKDWKGVVYDDTDDKYKKWIGLKTTGKPVDKKWSKPGQILEASQENREELRKVFEKS